jgi:hypothetical protein
MQNLAYSWNDELQYKMGPKHLQLLIDNDELQML